MGNTENEIEHDDKQSLEDMLRKYTNGYAQELPDGLTPDREVDHTIEIKENATPPYRSSSQLSSAGLFAT